MSTFIATKGVDKDKFIEAFHSFGVDNMVRKSNKKLKGYKVTGVPTIAVNGKYTISGRSAGSYENMLKIMDHLIEKEKSAKK